MSKGLVLGLDLPLNPPVWGHEGDVDLVGGTHTASEDSRDTTIPGKHNRPRVASVRKLAVLVVIRQHSDLDGCLHDDAMLLVGLLEGFEAIRATDSGPVADPFFTTSMHLSPWMSRCWGLRNSASGTTPKAWRRPSSGYW